MIVPASRNAWSDADMARLAELGRRALAGERAASLAASQLVSDRGGPPNFDVIEACRKRLVAERNRAAPA